MFCPKCGKELKDGALFCAFCGTRIQNEPQNTSQGQQQTGVSGARQKGNSTAGIAIIVTAVLAVIVGAIVAGFLIVNAKPSEKRIRKAIDDFGKANSCKIDITVEVPSMVGVVEAKIKGEMDGEIVHRVTTASAFGVKNETEEYFVGEYKYTLDGDDWVKEPKESSDSSDASDAGSLEDYYDSFIIESIEKGDDSITVKGTVDILFGEFDDAEIPGSLEMNYKLKLDKRCKIKTVEMEADDVSSEISKMVIRIYDVNKTEIELPEGLDTE